MSSFPKGLAHYFRQKFEYSSQSHFLDIMFNNDLNGKKGFLECKNVILT